MTSLSSIILGGLADRRERRLACACVVVIGLQAVALIALTHDARRFDVAFLAARAARRVLISTTHPFPIGADIAASPDGKPSARIPLLGGWSTPEIGGVWTASSVNEFAISLAQKHPEALSLSLDGYVLAPPGGQQTITLEDHGAAIGHWKLRGGRARLTARLSPSADRTIFLTLLIGRPTRPKASRDQRTLGFFMKTVAVTASPTD